MERKLVKQGRNALTITLPAQWLKERGLAAGHSIFIEECNAELRITTGLASRRDEVTLDLQGCERSLILHQIIGKYIEGYDSITLLHLDPKQAEEITPQLLGMIIEELTPMRIVLKSVIAVPEANFNAVFRRAAHILVQLARTLEGIAAGTATYEQLKAEERLLDSNILYCLRYLNKYEKTAHAYRSFLLCSTLEMAGDQLRYIAKHIGSKQELAQKTARGIEEYVSLLFQKDLQKLFVALRNFRNSLEQKTFVDGLAYSLAELLYNYIGYLVGEKAEKSGTLFYSEFPLKLNNSIEQ